jgi:hypothetical protein
MRTISCIRDTAIRYCRQACIDLPVVCGDTWHVNIVFVKAEEAGWSA